MSARKRRNHEKLSESQSTTTAEKSPGPSLISTILDLLKLVIPYIFDPFTFFSIYFPTIWPFITSFNPSTSIPDLTGKVILVTGGNTGLGRETILQLAHHNPKHIYMASRSASKAMTVIQEIKSQLPASTTSSTAITFLPLDLSSLPSIKAAASRFIAENQRLDMLILNAGIMATPLSLSASGHDLQLATNHIGHFLLAKLLLPVLQRTAAFSPSSDVRLVVVSSEAHHMSPPLATILSPSYSQHHTTSTTKTLTITPWARYGASKAANILFAAEFARHHPAITAISLHPGLIRTQLYSPSGADKGIIGFGMNVLAPLVMCDVQRGAWNQLWAATVHREELRNGGSYTPVGKLQRENRWANDEEAGRELWEWTEGELEKDWGYWTNS